MNTPTTQTYRVRFTEIRNDEMQIQAESAEQASRFLYQNRKALGLSGRLSGVTAKMKVQP